MSGINLFIFLNLLVGSEEKGGRARSSCAFMCANPCACVGGRVPGTRVFVCVYVQEAVYTRVYEGIHALTHVPGCSCTSMCANPYHKSCSHIHERVLYIHMTPARLNRRAERAEYK